SVLMSSSGGTRSPADGPTPLQLGQNVKTETSVRGISGMTDIRVKKEETLDLSICMDHEDTSTIITPDVPSVKEEEADNERYLYCEICKSYFFNKCEVHGSPLFLTDTPVPMGVSDRARQTLPPGLEIRKSSIPSAVLGVFNNGETVPVGAHFGPYQGELVEREEAMNSEYCWMMYKSGQCEEYIDAKRETHANWMRYVNCARNEGEQNLMAFKYRGGILYRCCRPIDSGHELLVWYDEEYGRDLGRTCHYRWNKKCSTSGIDLFFLTTVMASESQARITAALSACSFTLGQNVKTETSVRGISGMTDIRVKKEETLDLSICMDHEDTSTIITPDVPSVKEEEADNERYLYCEICESYFFNKCEVHGSPLFITDTPVPMGVSDRARQTLPPGLEIQKSGIPSAVLGVFNNGETVPVGAHFGPYQGELVKREEAMTSEYCWMMYKSGQCEEYIDAKRETHANWMRYVNCARNEGEQNLMAFKYRGGILYRCCRPIDSGHELLVWYDEEYGRDLGRTCHYRWNKKCSTSDVKNNGTQVFSCSSCSLSYTSQIDLNKHVQSYHCDEHASRQHKPEVVKHE
ncbi:histone-lysine N-methyltransferase PRDM9-like, partial [Clarias magur]